DGYTLLLSASGTIAVNPHLYKLRYDPVRDLAQISIAVEVPFVFVVGKGFAAQDYAAFKALSQRKPGGLTSANAGLGTQAHLTQASFAKLAGVSLAIVGYKGAAPAVNDVLGGHVDSMMDNAASQIPYVTTGKTTALFVTSDYRFDGYPDVPTARELGITGLVPAGWFGLAAPKGTPAEAIATLRAALAASLDEPPMREKLKALGWVIVGNTPEQALERARTDYERLGQVVRDIGLQPN
ncbi:MAG: tripartite tricarboxylate transporter substrate binding protein, partial [Achromobacter xylosoxidans]|nr:tripartite tricarboxylate transporter substrate binding protein [Achromobacter xylosoxidans]